MGKDVVKTYSGAVQELYYDYISAWETIDRLIHNMSIIKNLKVQLAEQQKEDIRLMHEAIIKKVEILASQIDSYGDFILDDSEYTDIARMQASVLIDKVNQLTEVVQQVIY